MSPTHAVTAVGETTSLSDRKRRAGQRLILGLEGPNPSPEEIALFREIRPAGFILFARNVEEPAQVKALNQELASLVPNTHPPLLTVDQEGGRVQRIRAGATRWPPFRWLGNCDDLDLTAQHARALSLELAAMGFNLNWAPVADVNSNPTNPVIGDRSLGDDAHRVARHLARWIPSAQAAGMMACAKHYPGHGDTDLDSHEALPRVERDRPDLEEVELRPFRAALAAGVAAVMTAHVMFPAFDEHWPATFSPALVRDLLRGQGGYDGVVVSDDMEMKAVRDRWALETQLEQGCLAGLDVFLVCRDPARQLAAFEAAVRLQEADPRQDDLAISSGKRLLALRERFLRQPWTRPGLDVLGCGEHALLAELIRQRGAEGQGPGAA